VEISVSSVALDRDDQAHRPNFPMGDGDKLESTTSASVMERVERG